MGLRERWKACTRSGRAGLSSSGNRGIAHSPIMKLRSIGADWLFWQLNWLIKVIKLRK